MKKAIVLNDLDVKTMLDICEYVLSDDKELNDFLENCDSAENAFNEYDVLELDKVDKNDKTHIYYLVEYIRQQLTELTHGE